MGQIKDGRVWCEKCDQWFSTAWAFRRHECNPARPTSSWLEEARSEVRSYDEMTQEERNGAGLVVSMLIGILRRAVEESSR